MAAAFLLPSYLFPKTPVITPAMPRTVHVLQGLSAAGCFFQAMRPNRGDLLANEDVLSCGPLLPFQSLEQWAGIREAYWHSLLPSGYETPLHRDLSANAEALREAESIVLWLGLG